MFKKFSSKIRWQYMIILFIVINIPFIFIIRRLYIDEIENFLLKYAFDVRSSNLEFADVVNNRFNHIIKIGDPIAENESVKLFLRELLFEETKSGLGTTTRFSEDMERLLTDLSYVERYKIILNSDRIDSASPIIYLDNNRFSAFEAYYNSNGRLLIADFFKNKMIETEYGMIIKVNPSKGFRAYLILELDNLILQTDNELQGEHFLSFDSQYIVNADKMITNKKIVDSSLMSSVDAYLISTFDTSALIQQHSDVLFKRVIAFVAIIFTIMTIIFLSIFMMIDRQRLNALNLQRNQYEERLTKLKQAVRHDILNALQVISGLIEINANSRASDYIKTYINDSEFTKHSVNVFSSELSTVLYMFESRGREIGISFDCEIQVEQVKIRDYYKVTDMVEAFHNLLFDYLSSQKNTIRVVYSSVSGNSSSVELETEVSYETISSSADSKNEIVLNSYKMHKTILKLLQKNNRLVTAKSTVKMISERIVYHINITI